MKITVDDILSTIKDMNLPGIDVDSLSTDTSLLEQGLDSLDMMNLYFQIEEQFDKQIEFDAAGDEMNKWNCIADIVEQLNT